MTTKTMGTIDVDWLEELLNEAWNRIVDNDILAWRDAKDLEEDLTELNDQIEWAREPTFLEALPIIGKHFDKKEFKQKSFEWKMNDLFTWYKVKMDALDESVEAMSDYKQWLEEYYTKFKESVKGVVPEELDVDDQFEYTQRIKSIVALETSINRISIRLSDTQKIYRGMQLSLPRYRMELKGAVIEIGASKRLTDWLGIWQTFETKATKTQTMLTTGVIESNKATNVTWKDVMSLDKIRANSSKLLSAVGWMNGDVKLLSSGE